MSNPTDFDYLALDIGAREHAWCASVHGQEEEGVVSNTPEALKALLKRLLKRTGKLRVLCEATGIYFLDTALLAKALGAEVMVINPRKAHHFAQALGQRNKTDRVDARMLLDCLLRMPFAPWQPPSANRLALRSYGRYLSQQTQDRSITLNRLHAYSATGQTPAFLLQELKRKVANIDRAIERVRAEAIRLIKADSWLQERFMALQSIIGVGEVSAISLLSELAALPEELNSRACTSMAGLDPRAYESGSSIRRPSRISRHGNSYLRQALFMPALSASLHDPGARLFMQCLVEERSKKKIQAIVAIMRKMLTVAWAMMKNPQTYDPEKLYNALKR